MRQALAVVLAVLVAAVGVIGFLVWLQSRDHGALDRPPVTQTTAP